MPSLLWHFSEKNSIIACNYLFTVVNRVVFKIFWCRVFSNFLPKKKKLTKFYTRKEEEKSKYFPCFCTKKTKLVPGNKKTLELCYRAHDLIHTPTAAHNMHTWTACTWIRSVLPVLVDLGWKHARGHGTGRT
jgi:hypothetical protein